MCDSRLETKKKRWFWCPFHREILLKWTDEQFFSRLRTIYERKSLEDHPVRFSNFRPVVSKLPPELDEAWDEIVEAEDEYNKVVERYWEGGRSALLGSMRSALCEAANRVYRAWKRFREVLLEKREAIRALYEKEQPNGRWNWDTMTLDISRIS